MRNTLSHLEGEIVSVKGRIVEYRHHPTRKDLKTVLLRSLEVKSLGSSGSNLLLDHLWFLDRHLRGIGIKPRINSKIMFIGSVYSYTRLSNSSRDNGKYSSVDYAVLPVISSQENTNPNR